MKFAAVMFPFRKNPRDRSASQIAPPRVPDGMRVYVIGDIHGRSDLLDRLHGKIRSDAKSGAAQRFVTIYLGDYIDRGPDSAGVLDRLVQGALPGSEQILLKGNHEDMLERFLAHPETAAGWRQLGGAETLASYRIDVRQILGQTGPSAMSQVAEQLKAAMPAAHRSLLASLKHSATIGDYFFCHAGVRPGVALGLQSPSDLLWIRHEFLSSKELFEKMIVHGHTPVPRAEFHPNRINVDTGAYMSGILTCLVLESEQRRLLE